MGYCLEVLVYFLDEFQEGLYFDEFLLLCAKFVLVALQNIIQAFLDITNLTLIIPAHPRHFPRKPFQNIRLKPNNNLLSMIFIFLIRPYQINN